MPVYSGVGGVTKETFGLDVCVGGVTREVLVGYAGVDGVLRSFISLEDRIDHFVMELADIEVYDTSSGENVVIGTDLASALKNGCSVSLADSSIQVLSSRVNRAILINGVKLNAVFKDTHERTLYSMANVLNTDYFSMSIPVTTSENISGNGETYARVEGNPLLDGQTNNLTEIKFGGTFAYARLDSGSFAKRTVVFTDGITINGVKIPIK